MMDGSLDESGLNANGLTTEEQATFDNLYGTNPGTAEAPKPGFFAGIWKSAAALPAGLAASGADVVQAAGHGVSVLTDIANQPVQIMQAAQREQSAQSGQPPQTDFEQLADFGPAIQAWGEQSRRTSDEFYRPDPQTTGTAGNMLFGAIEPITRIGVGSLVTGGRAGLEFAAGSMGYERAQDLRAQGVDPTTAAESGLVIAGTFELMGAFGGEGGTLAQRVLKSAAINTGAGIVNRSLDSAVLNAAGYNKLAQQQQWNDAQAIISDMVIGAAFPLVHAGAARLIDASAARSETKLADKITQSPDLFDALRMPDGNVSQFSIEAALASLNAQHARDVAPGVPIDGRSQGLHLKALDAAIQQTMRGEPVYIEPIARDMNTIPRPVPDGKAEGLSEALAEETGMPEADPFRYAVRDEGGAITGYERDGNFIPAFKNLTDAQREVEARAAGQVLDDPEQAIADYARLRGTDNGNLVNTDEARELFSDYNAGPEARSMNALSVHEPSSWVAKQAWERALARAPREGKENMVFFTGGGTGAGKSTGPKRIPALASKQSGADITFDGNLNGFDSARKKIDAALASGRKVHILYTFRDPIQAFIHGALPRAERADYGRTVPIKVHVDTHVGAAETYLKLKQHYDGNSNVTIEAIHNDYEPGVRSEVRRVSDADVAQRAAANRDILASEVRDAFEHERQASRVSDRVYHGTLGTRPRPEGDGAAGLGGVVRPTPEVGPLGSDSGGVRPESNPQDLNPAAGGVSASGPLMQNRDRARAASVAQMAAIANAPDAQRLGFSRDPNTGAPMVSTADPAKAVPESDLGKQDVVIFADGRKIPVRYAVVGAGDVAASHSADGTVNPNYENAPLQALNNGRVAGVQGAWVAGHGAAYKADLIEDAATVGIDPKVIEAKAHPLVIRLYDAKANFGDMGKASNDQTSLGLSPSEQAMTDARALPDLSTLPLTESGELSARPDDAFHRAFLRNLGTHDAAELVDASGRLNKTYMDRLRAALFAKAYGNDRLTALQTEVADPDARNVLNALTAAAPAWAKVDQAAPLGDYAARLAAAMDLVQQAAASGKKVAAFLAQGDLLARDTRGDAWARFFAENARSAKRMTEALRDAAEQIASYQRQLLNRDMFGTRALDADQVTRTVLKLAEDRYGREQPQQSGTLFNAAGRVTRDAGTRLAGDATGGRQGERAGIEGAAAGDASRVSDAADAATGTVGTGEAATSGRTQSRSAAADSQARAGTGLDQARVAEVADADRIAAQRPTLKLDDGTTAADAVRAADAEQAQAQQQADGIAAAVSCFLNFGSEV